MQNENETRTQFRTVSGYRLSSLFIENKYVEDAPYTLGDIDRTFKDRSYPSLYKLYMEMSDISEYYFANKYLESYQHWLALTEQEWFKPYLMRWRKELELKIKAGALLEIIAQSKAEDPKKRLEASKYLYEKVGSENKGKGRPSKAEVKEEAKRIAIEQKILDEHSRLLN